MLLKNTEYMLYVRLEIYKGLNAFFWNTEVSVWRFIRL